MRSSFANGADDVLLFVFEEEMFPFHFFCQITFNPSEITPAKFAGLECVSESLRRFCALRDDHCSGGISIQSVDESNVGAAEIFTKPIHQIFVTCVFALTQQSSGFVE